MTKKYRIPLSFCIAALWLFCIYRFAGIYFETNDDRILTEIFSGAMTGSPEAHAYYVNYLLGFLLSSLYRLTTAIPWYGGMLVLFQFLCHFLIVDAFLSRSKSKKNFFFAFIFCVLLYAAGFYTIANIQFTSTAAMLAIIGYLCFFLYPKGKIRYILFFLLEFFSFLLRSNAMFMIQPMGFLTLAGFYCVQHKLYSFLPMHAPYASPSKNTWFEKCRPLLYAAAILCSIVILGKGSYYIFYSSSGWQEYKKVNDGVTEITDYSAIPEYAKVQDILQKYDVTEKQYNAFLQYTMIEENLSGDCLLEIAEVAHAENIRPSFLQTCKQLLESYAAHEYRGLNLLLIAVWGSFLLYIFLGKKFLLLLPLSGLFLSRSALWLFLLYEGRTPLRIMIPLYLAELSLLFCLFFLTILNQAGKPVFPDTPLRIKNEHYPALPQNNQAIRKYLPIILILLLLPFAAKTLRNQYLHLSAKNANESIYFSGMQDIISYCNNHSEKRYFIDASALLYYRGGAFETKIYGSRNAVITGCWYSGAPVLYQYEKDYFSDCDTIYLITSSDMEMQSGMVIAYLEERLKTNAYLEEVFTVSNGGKYLVYGFSI